MEQGKLYRISPWIIGTFLVSGMLFFLLFIWALTDALQEGWIVTLQMLGFFFAMPLPFLVYSIYLWKKRKEGRGFYWDEEGIVIDLKGNKVYWEEIEEIQFRQLFSLPWTKSTVVYPHYTHHEKIRARRNKWMPTPAHSIDWILIEKPKEYHKNLLKVWQEKQNLLE